MHGNHRQSTSPERMVDDMGKGFGAFVDSVLRGRDSKMLLNSSIGAGALEIGWPKPITVEGFDGEAITSTLPFDITRMITNNKQVVDSNSQNWSDGLFNDQHPLFDFDANNFTLFGLDLPDMWNQIQAGLGYLSTEQIDALKKSGELGGHGSPIYTNQEGGVSNIATELGLPDLPYGGIAHFAMMGAALYDTGRTFHDLWKEPALKHNVLKIMTHPEMTETLLHRGVMLTVMGLLHPLGPLVSIGVSFLCAHLVHSAFKMLEGNKNIVKRVADVPVLGAIYNASGFKEWAENETYDQEDLGSIADIGEDEISNLEPTVVTLPNEPVTAGNPHELRFRLVDKDSGQLLSDQDLLRTHEELIHTMVVNSSLTDYHHLHPIYDPKSQSFVCHFTPNSNEPYHAWHDFAPLKGARTFHVKTELESSQRKAVQMQFNPSNKALSGSYQMEAEFSPPLRTGVDTTLTIRVRDEEGNIVTNLEPMMGAFAHLVGFSDDGLHYIHAHPMGDEPVSADERGTGVLQFHIKSQSDKPIRFFLQSRMEGKEHIFTFDQKSQGKAQGQPNHSIYSVKHMHHELVSSEYRLI